MDSDSKYYDFFNGEEYPSVVCSRKCGAFVSETSATEPIRDAAYNSEIFTIVWKLLFVYPYVPWVAIVFMGVGIAMIANTVYVTKLASVDKIRNLELQMQSLASERKKQETIILKLKEMDS